MIRERNIIKNALAGSECAMHLSAPASLARDLAAAVNTDDLMTRGGTVTVVPQANDTDRASLKIVLPHAEIDAFGCYALIRSYTMPAEDYSVAPLSGELRGEHDRWSWIQAWRRTPPKDNADKDMTSTQRLLSGLVTQLDTDTKFAMAVCLDALHQWDAVSPWGNSMMLLPYDHKNASALAHMPKSDWIEKLRSDGNRLLAIAERRGLPAKPMEKTVVVSAAGRLDRFPWMPKLHPSLFVGFPTPSHDSSATLFTWSVGDIEALTVCASKVHPLIASFESIHTMWAGA